MKDDDEMNQLVWSVLTQGVLTPAVELSYLTGQEQQDLLETMESEDCTPSLSQAVQLKKLSQYRELSMDKTFKILREPKANQQEKIRAAPHNGAKDPPKPAAPIVRCCPKYHQKMVSQLFEGHRILEA